MNELSEYIPQLIIMSGFLLLAIEVVVLGFSTFILFFLGLSLVVTGALAWAGIMPATWPVMLLANALLTTAIAGVLWRPLLRLQGDTDNARAKSDFEGHQFILEAEVDKTGKQKYRYSDIEWQLKSEQPLQAGSEVKVVKAEVGVLWLAPVSKNL